MINRGLTIAMFLLMGGVCSAQNGAILELSPLDKAKVEKAPKPSDVSKAPKTENKKNDLNREEEPVPYEYPQAHSYGAPVEVGSGQLNVHRGYWLPGGYEPRSGSPYFYSVPGAPARGPLGGTVASGYTGGNPQLDGYSSGASYGNNNGGGYANNGYANNGYVNNGNSSNGYGSNGYNAGGYADGSAMSGGAGGDPYQYHFGPGFYRSGEHGHFRFPFYSYRRPWYHPGFAGYNRDTNLPW